MIPSSYTSFAHERFVHHSALVVPVMVVWREYTAYCHRWGFDQIDAARFVSLLRTEEGTEIKEGGRGRLHRCITGLGLRPDDDKMFG